MSENQVSRRIEALITPVLADLGLEMYDLEYNGGIVKITVDTPPVRQVASMSINCRNARASFRANSTTTIPCLVTTPLKSRALVLSEISVCHAIFSAKRVSQRRFGYKTSSMANVA